MDLKPIEGITPSFVDMLLDRYSYDWQPITTLDGILLHLGALEHYHIIDISKNKQCIRLNPIGIASLKAKCWEHGKESRMAFLGWFFSDL